MLSSGSSEDVPTAPSSSSNPASRTATCDLRRRFTTKSPTAISPNAPPVAPTTIPTTFPTECSLDLRVAGEGLEEGVVV